MFMRDESHGRPWRRGPGDDSGGLAAFLVVLLVLAITVALLVLFTPTPHVMLPAGR